MVRTSGGRVGWACEACCDATVPESEAVNTQAAEYQGSAPQPCICGTTNFAPRSRPTSMSGGRAKVDCMGPHQRRYALWALLARTRRGFTLRELAQRFGVAKNTIQRDLDHLSTGGMNVSEEQAGQTRLFRATGGPPGAELTPDEKLALRMAEVSFVPWAGSPLAIDLTSALAKVGAGNDELPFEMRGPVPRVRTAPGVLKTLLTGLRERRCCRLLYQRRGAREPRALEVEPLRIVAAAGLLYLRAIVRPRGVVVTLALHLVKAAALLNERYASRENDSSAFGASYERPERVVVRFHPEIAPFIEERIWHPSQRLRYESDGSLRFEATLGGMHEFVGWVMSWGANAELLAPSAWREEVASRAQVLARRHTCLLVSSPATNNP
jgi:predicted DNA-binding transcriptional regulator YafY